MEFLGQTWPIVQQLEARVASLTADNERLTQENLALRRLLEGARQ